MGCVASSFRYQLFDIIKQLWALHLCRLDGFYCGKLIYVITLVSWHAHACGDSIYMRSLKWWQRHRIRSLWRECGLYRATVVNIFWLNSKLLVLTLRLAIGQPPRLLCCIASLATATDLLLGVALINYITRNKSDVIYRKKVRRHPYRKPHE